MIFSDEAVNILTCYPRGSKMQYWAATSSSYFNLWFDLNIDCESTGHQLSIKSLAKLPVLTRSPPWPSWFSRRHKTESQDSHYTRNSEKILTETYIKFNGWELHAKMMKMKQNAPWIWSLQPIQKMKDYVLGAKDYCESAIRNRVTGANRMG